MKKIIGYILVLSAGLVLLGSCTKNFERIHDGYFGVTDEDLTRDNQIVGAGFQNIMKAVYFNSPAYSFQLYQNLNADVFSGYMASPNWPNSQLNYFLNAAWNDSCWGFGYNVMSDSQKNLEACMIYGFPELGVFDNADEALQQDWKESLYRHYIAVNTVCRVLGMSRIADQYGPIIYSAYGTTDMEGSPYDSLEDVYAQFFAELTEAVEVLDWAVNNPSADFSQFDIVYGGDMAKWARLANSLKARLAMRIVKADPEEAQRQFEAAFAAPQGLMRKGDNYVLVGNNWVNGIYGCSWTYGDIFMGADIVSIMEGHGDPRLPLYGIPIDGKVVSIRLGLPDTAGRASGSRKEQYVPNAITHITNLSYINIPAPDYRSILMYAAETQFLLAEAALRGWNVGGGTAESFYVQGVADSFADWGVSGAEGFLTGHAVPADYVDALYSDFNIAAVSTVTPNWADATSDEERLERIITQKWIANFPEGMNAWAEYRRTGYPVKFPIMDNQSQGVIDSELGVRRLPFTVDQVSKNPDNIRAAISMLGGPDTGATRLWWDVDRGNF